MIRRLVCAALALLLGPAVSLAQPPSPVPVDPGAAPRSITPEPLPPLAPGPQPAGSANTASPAGTSPPAAAAPASAPAMSAPAGRVFCEQPITVQVAERGAIAEPY